MKRIVSIALTALVCLSLTGCSKIYYYFNDMESFRFENESDQKIYMASISFGTEDTVFGSMSGENADGTALADKGKDCLVFPIEEGDMNDTALEDMVFDFYVCTVKDSDFIYVGRVIVTSQKLHQTYTLTVKQENDKLILSSNDSNIDITYEVKS